MLFMHTQQTQRPCTFVNALAAGLDHVAAACRLVQVMQTPSAVISHLHAIIRLQQQTYAFIIMQQLTCRQPSSCKVLHMVATFVFTCACDFQPPLHSRRQLAARTIIHWACGVVGVPPWFPGHRARPAFHPARSIKIVMVIWSILKVLITAQITLLIPHVTDYKEAASDFKINYQRFDVHDHPIS